MFKYIIAGKVVCSSKCLLYIICFYMSMCVICSSKSRPGIGGPPHPSRLGGQKTNPKDEIYIRENIVKLEH